jgi:hypothetical protein
MDENKRSPNFWYLTVIAVLVWMDANLTHTHAACSVFCAHRPCEGEMGGS